MSCGSHMRNLSITQLAVKYLLLFSGDSSVPFKRPFFEIERANLGKARLSPPPNGMGNNNYTLVGVMEN